MIINTLLIYILCNRAMVRVSKSIVMVLAIRASGATIPLNPHHVEFHDGSKVFVRNFPSNYYRWRRRFLMDAPSSFLVGKARLGLRGQVSAITKVFDQQRSLAARKKQEK